MKLCSRCKQQPRQKSHNYCRGCAKEYAKQAYREKRPTPILDARRAVGDVLLKKHPAFRMYHSAKNRAKEKGLEFSISLSDIRIPAVCPVLGIPLDRRDMRHTPSLDRFNNDLGYVPGNVGVISHRANSLKQDATKEELEKVLAYVRKGI